jgi:outer membrane lipoprotein carrier protein
MFRKSVVTWALGLSVSLLSVSSLASEAELKRFFIDVSSLQANFEQEVVDESGKSLDSKTGVFSFLRPGKFRWNYASTDEFEPLGQQIISDGHLITFYEPDLDSAVQSSMSDTVAQVPSMLLVQSGENIDTHFTVTDYGKTDGLTWVGLKPKDLDSGYQSLMVGFAGKQLSAILMTDALGNETRLTLSEVITNTKFARDLFTFVPSASTDVVRR